MGRKRRGKGGRERERERGRRYLNVLYDELDSARVRKQSRSPPDAASSSSAKLLSDDMVSVGVRR